MMARHPETARLQNKKYLERCEVKRRHDESVAEANRIVATGKCPRCGSPLKRNNSLAGWWQCSAVGACLFQCFTA